MAIRILKIALLLLVGGAVVFYGLTVPASIRTESIPNHSIDLVNGENLFWAGGCASCHAAPEAEGEEKLLLGGGVELHTPFGVFFAPNLSPHKDGIGGWTDGDFINAMTNGVSPAGEHYYPAFPYTNYRLMPFEDLMDLKAFIDTLTPVAGETDKHQLAFPYSFRRGLGLWKLLYLNSETFVAQTDVAEQIERGRYLVDGPGHCGACHTPRNTLGGEIAERYLAGAVSFEIDRSSGETTEGWIPNITPHEEGIGDWSASDIAYSLESGFTPEFDSFGGSMASVQSNMSKLPASDREAIAVYLKSIEKIGE